MCSGCYICIAKRLKRKRIPKPHKSCDPSCPENFGTKTWIMCSYHDGKNCLKPDKLPKEGS